MKKLGFKKLDISLATGDVATRKEFKRPEHVNKYEEILKTANVLGIDVTTYIIIGYPRQPLEEMKQTVEYLKIKKTLISPSVFYNVPGMPVFDKMKKYEYSAENFARRGSFFNCYGDDFTRDDIFKISRDIRVYNQSNR